MKNSPSSVTERDKKRTKNFRKWKRCGSAFHLISSHREICELRPPFTHAPALQVQIRGRQFRHQQLGPTVEVRLPRDAAA